MIRDVAIVITGELGQEGYLTGQSERKEAR